MILRPLAPQDAEVVGPLAFRAFEDLAVRQNRPPRGSTPQAQASWTRAHAHLLRTGRGIGAYDDDGGLLGVALSYRREATWVLALLVVEPGRQSAGAGSALLREVLREAPPQRILHASQDPRAVRAYARAGFRLLPALRASGRPQGDGGDLVREADLRRDAGAAGCAHLVEDLAHLVGGGGRVLAAADGRPGLAVVQGAPGFPKATVLAAPDAPTAQDLLRGALAVAGGLEGDVEVGPLAPQEHWAVEVLLDAGLDVAPSGPVAVAGLTDPLAGLQPPPAVYI